MCGSNCCPASWTSHSLKCILWSESSADGSAMRLCSQHSRRKSNVDISVQRPTRCTGRNLDRSLSNPQPFVVAAETTHPWMSSPWHCCRSQVSRDIPAESLRKSYSDCSNRWCSATTRPPRSTLRGRGSIPTHSHWLCTSWTVHWQYPWGYEPWQLPIVLRERKDGDTSWLDRRMWHGPTTYQFECP